MGARSCAAVVAFLAVIAVCAAAAPPARAAFPGSNGLIAFTGATEDGRRGLWTVRPDGTDRKLLRADTAPVAPAIHDPAWSADGKHLAFVDADRLAIVDPDGSDLRYVTDTLASGRPSDPAWSPDGSRLVFTRGDGRTTYADLWTVRPDGTGLAPLTSSPELGESQPAWSPDGSRIAFAGHRLTTLPFSTRVYTVKPDGTDRQLVGPHAELEPNEWHPNWSPDGGRLLVQLGQPYDYGVAVIDVAAHTSKLLRFGGNAPVFSPDGAHLAFSTPTYYSGGQIRGDSIAVSRPDGSETVVLASAWTSDFRPDWQPVTASPPVNPPDAAPPAFSLAGRTTQKLARSVTLLVRARSEDMWASLSGKLRVSGASKAYKLKGIDDRFIADGSRATLRAHVPKRATGPIKRALRRHRIVKAKLRLEARDAAGNTAVKKLAIKLVLKRKHQRAAP